MEAWMNQTWWLYDLTVLAICVLCIWGGWQRGMIRTIVSLLGYVSAGLLSGLLAQPATEYVYTRWLEQPCTELVTQQLEQYHLSDQVQQALSAYGMQVEEATLKQMAENPDAASQQFYAAAAEKTGIPTEVLQRALTQSVDRAAVQAYTGMPEWMVESLLPSSAEDSKAVQNRAVQTAAILLTEDDMTAAKTLVREYIRPAIIRLGKVFMFSVLFLLISLLLQGIIKWISYLRRVDGMHFSDQVFGATIGAVQAALLVGFMVKLTQWLMTAGSGQIAFFNEAVLSKTVLFQGLYHMLT